MTHNQQIAQTILNQMGGKNRLIAMVGAKNFMAIDNGVQFDFAKAIAGINRVTIRLTFADLYDIEFGSVRKSRKTQLPEYTARDVSQGVFADRLKPIFERATGLYLNI